MGAGTRAHAGMQACVKSCMSRPVCRHVCAQGCLQACLKSGSGMSHKGRDLPAHQVQVCTVAPLACAWSQTWSCKTHRKACATEVAQVGSHVASTGGGPCPLRLSRVCVQKKRLRVWAARRKGGGAGGLQGASASPPRGSPRPLPAPAGPREPCAGIQLSGKLKCLHTGIPGSIFSQTVYLASPTSNDGPHMGMPCRRMISYSIFCRTLDPSLRTMAQRTATLLHGSIGIHCTAHSQCN